MKRTKRQPPKGQKKSAQNRMQGLVFPGEFQVLYTAPYAVRYVLHPLGAVVPGLRIGITFRTS